MHGPTKEHAPSTPPSSLQSPHRGDINDSFRRTDQVGVDECVSGSLARRLHDGGAMHRLPCTSSSWPLRMHQSGQWHAAAACTMHLRPYVCNSQSSSKMTTREAASSQVRLGRLPLERRLTTRKPKRLPRATLLTPCRSPQAVDAWFSQKHGPCDNCGSARRDGHGQDGLLLGRTLLCCGYRVAHTPCCSPSRPPCHVAQVTTCTLSHSCSE
jgi:hypothetical protein